LGINNQLNNSLKISGVSDFKKIIINYLNIHKTEFNKLNNGQIFIKYNSISNYSNFINNKSSLYWGDIIDIIEKIINLNILIIDIPHTQSSKTKILCRPGHTYNPDKSSIILLKKRIIDDINKTSIDSFELVINLQTISNKEKTLTKQFSFDNKIVKFLINYYTKSCVKEYIYPDNYIYKKMYTIDSIKKLNLDKVGKIKYQVNYKGRVSLLMTTKNILLPIQETGSVDNLENITLQDIYSNLLTLDDYIKYYKHLEIKILGVAISNKENIGGLLSEFGYFIPYRLTKIDNNKINKLKFIYYFDIDEKLTGKQTTQINNGIINQYNIFNKHVDLMNDHIFKLKTAIAKRIEGLNNREQVIKYIKEVIITTNFSKLEKINKVVKILLQLFRHTKITPHILFLLKNISNEIILDNIEHSLLNGIVNQNKSGELYKRETESILLNLDDIYKWIRTYQEN
jgi:hypothetical protein